MPFLSFDQNSTPLYLLSGDEPLLLRDWLDGARDSLKQAGFEDIQSHSIRHYVMTYRRIRYSFL